MGQALICTDLVAPHLRVAGLSRLLHTPMVRLARIEGTGSIRYSVSFPAARRVYHRLECTVTNNGALTTHSHPNRNRWLIAIGVLKLLKAVLFVSMGFGVIRLLHKDIADVLLRGGDSAPLRS